MLLRNAIFAMKTRVSASQIFNTQFLLNVIAYQQEMFIYIRGFSFPNICVRRKRNNQNT